MKNGSRGWYNEFGANAATVEGNRTHPEDWRAIGNLATWIGNISKTDQPWMGYVGTNIVRK